MAFNIRYRIKDILKTEDSESANEKTVSMF